MRKAKYPAAAEAGIVRTHAQTIRIPTAQFTFFLPWESPPQDRRGDDVGGADRNPHRGRGEDDRRRRRLGAEAVDRLQFHEVGPTVLMMRHPPIAVPSAIAVAQEAITHSGTWKTGIAP